MATNATNETREFLAEREKEIRKSYKRVVPGSIKQDKDTQKLSVEVGCAKRGCAENRRVFTSDLFQIKHCVECTLELRAERRRERRNGAKPVRAKKARPARAARQPKAEPELVTA